MPNNLATPEDFLRIENRNMQQTIYQLRANAKSHKKTVDKLSAKVSQLTQENADLQGKQKTKRSVMASFAAGSFAFGFLAAIGVFCAIGWMTLIGKLL